MHATIGHVLRELHADAGEFLREESGLFAAADEVDAFSAGVDELRDAVERLEKRLGLLVRSDARRP
jgi:ubiquinone biosynthesis protein UbiJ